MDKRQRIALLGIAAVIAAVAIVIAVASGGSDKKGTSTTTQATTAGGQTPPTSTPDTSAAPASPQPVVEKIVVKGGQPDGGLRKITVKKGEQVEIDVVSDTADEAHLHGYNIEKPLTPGRTTRFRFTANIEGVFELELHHAKSQLAKVTVKP